MNSILSSLEWLARYGFIDILFGIGVISLIVHGVRRLFPRNLSHLYVHASQGSFGNLLKFYKCGLHVLIVNAENEKVFISRAFFQPYYRKFPFRKRNTILDIHPDALRDSERDRYILQFPDKPLEQQIAEQAISFSVLDVLINPGDRALAGLALSRLLDQKTTDSILFGTVILEYSIAGRSGKHLVRV